MDHANLVAIDIHTHAEVSCWNPFDNYGEEYDRAADKYFRNSRRWMKDFEDAGFKPEVMPGILKGNAVRLLGLA